MFSIIRSSDLTNKNDALYFHSRFGIFIEIQRIHDRSKHFLLTKRLQVSRENFRETFRSHTMRLTHVKIKQVSKAFRFVHFKFVALPACAEALTTRTGALTYMLTGKHLIIITEYKNLIYKTCAHRKQKNKSLYLYMCQVVGA